MKLIKKGIPEKCKNCSIEEEYRPLYPSCCRFCIQNKKAAEEVKKNENKSNR